MTKTNVTAPMSEKEVPQSRDYPALEIDYELYMQMLEDSEWNDEQKREFIETMWSIIVSFVDLGFGVHPVQQAQDACAQIEDRSGVGANDLVSSWDEANTEQDSKQGAGRLDTEAS